MTDQPPPTTPNVNVLPHRPEAATLAALAPHRRWRMLMLKEAATLDTASMILIDSEGGKSEADPDKFGYIPDDRNIFLENVNPGVTDKGRPSLPWRPIRWASSSSWATPTS